MPSDTFFRLPEEKRQRFLNAAWYEFTTARFSDVSINQIIRNAKIPRGSFYQYFTDKDDLFHYLTHSMHTYFLDLFRLALKKVRGDLRKFPLFFFDAFLQTDQEFNENLNRCIQLIRCNPGPEFQASLYNYPKPFPHTLMDEIDTTSLRSSDPIYITEVVHLFMMITGIAVIETLLEPERLEEHRTLLALRTELLVSGCYATECPSY